MPELALLVVFLLVFLTIVTLVGHGIWVALAYLFGSLSDKERNSAGISAKPHCPRCRSLLPSRDSQCVICAWPGEHADGLRHGLIATELRQRLAALRTAGALSDEAYQSLRESLKALETPPSSAQQSAPPIEAAEEAAPPPVAPPAANVPAQAKPAELVPDTPAERARKFTARKQVAPVETAQKTKPPRRERLSELFAVFLEEKNIRWGELVGGLLIVCCSAALVISFWSEIAARPLLKFSVFSGVSAMLFGIGFYTNKKWEIHTTSQGILTIAMMLVPLNFLAIAAFTSQSPPTDMLTLGGEGVSLILFGLLTYCGARFILPQAPLLATLGAAFADGTPCPPIHG